MKKVLQSRYKRFVFAFVSILFIFLFMVISIIVSQHREMREEIESDARHELDLIGSFAREALIMKDYAAVEQFLVQWAEEHDEILEIKATAPNNFVLAHYKRFRPAISSIDLYKDITFENRKLITLEMTKDLTPAQRNMLKLSLPLILGSIFLTVVIGLLLWYAVRKLALIPMEQEILMREQAERKFRLLLESAPDAMIFVDKEGKILMINAQTELLFGYNRRELEGKEIETLIPERLREKHKKFREKYIFKPEARPLGLDMELFGLTKKGSEFPADISLSPIETDEGLFTLAAVRDVTERKLTEMKIRRSYQFQEAISSILSNSLKPIPLEKQLQNVLDTILSIPGLSLESMGCIYLVEEDDQLLTMKAQRGLPEEIKTQCARVHFSHCLCGQAASSREIIFSDCTDSLHTDHPAYGNEKPHSHYCVPVTAGDKTLGVINLVVSKGHKRSIDEEEMLKSVANTIAGIIEHSRTDMDRQKLQERLAHAEKLSALGRFTANVAHDIRTPLTLIGGFARRLNRDFAEGTKHKEYLNIIINEVNRLENILKNVLTYSGHASLNRQLNDLNNIIQHSLEAFQEKFDSQAIQIQKRLNEIPPVILDKDQFIEVISNLFSNAMDSMPSGGTLSVLTEKNTVQDKEYAVVNVSDTGEGMSDDQLKMIFEPFYSTKIIGHGTGLGLPISRKIIEDHGGFISVDSKIGKGSTFRLYIPVNGKPDNSR